MTPEELNETPDDKIQELVAHLVLRRDVGGHEVHPISPFLTLELLRRVHEHVVHLINSRVCPTSKHKALACAMCGMTGVSEPPDERDTDKIGNHIDIWIRRKYIDVERKLYRNTRNKENLEKKRKDLRESCCVVSPMGTIQEFHGPFDDGLQSGDGASINAARKRPAPYVAYTRSTLPAAMTMLELKDLALEAQRQAASAEADSKKERQRSDGQRIHVEAVKSRCKRAAAEAASARKLAKSAKQEVSNAEAQAAKRLSEFAKQAQVESVRRQREAAEQLRIEQAKVVRLGSQVAAASHEAGIHARREAEIQKKAELERARAETELRELAAEAGAQRAKHMREERESAKALQDARARVLRLGSQVVSATQEAATHAKREEDALLQLQQERARAALEADLRRDAAKEERAQRRKDERAAEQLLADARAKLLRLGSQVAAASQEAARLAHEKELVERAKLDTTSVTVK